MKHVSFKLVNSDNPDLRLEYWAGYIGNGKAVHALDSDNMPRCRSVTSHRLHRNFRSTAANITCQKCLTTLAYFKNLANMRDWQED